MKMAILELEYKNIRKITALKLPFTKADGSVISNNFIMMANGTGKTTTMELIKGLFDGTAAGWTASKVRSFAPTLTEADTGEFSITVKFDDRQYMLEKFMFRHKSVCNLGHQKLSELYMQEAVKIRRDPENYRLTDLRTTLKEYIETECTDAVFKVGLSNLKYRTNGGNKPLRYLFSTLNEHIEWYRNGAVGVPAPQKGTVINYDNVTIEHIASQSPSAAVPGFTSENIHTLSNLTLLTNGENDRAKNKAYTAKKVIYHDSEYRHDGDLQRRGCENPVQYAGPLQRRIYSGHLYAHHQRYAERCG